MPVASDTDERLTATTMVPPELLVRANSLVKSHPQCFWFWRRNAVVRDADGVRLVIEHLREHGDARAWRDAQELHRCLSPYFKSRS